VVPKALPPLANTKCVAANIMRGVADILHGLADISCSMASILSNVHFALSILHVQHQFSEILESVLGFSKGKIH